MVSPPPSHNLANIAAPIKSAATMKRDLLVIFKSFPSPSSLGGNTYDMGGIDTQFHQIYSGNGPAEATTGGNRVTHSVPGAGKQPFNVHARPPDRLAYP